MSLIQNRKCKEQYDKLNAENNIQSNCYHYYYLCFCLTNIMFRQLLLKGAKCIVIVRIC